MNHDSSNNKFKLMVWKRSFLSSKGYVVSTVSMGPCLFSGVCISFLERIYSTHIVHIEFRNDMYI